MNTLQNARVLITGGSQGLGRAIVEAFLARGARVTAIARSRAALEEVQRVGVDVFAGDATNSEFMDRIVRDFDPSVLVLNAGARLVMKPIDKLSFEEFSVNWTTDVKAGLHGIQAAFKAPMRPGSRVLLMSSGAAMVLSHPLIPAASLRLSGGAVGAKRMVWYMAHSANAVSRERSLGIHFQALLPTQVMAATEFGRSIAAAYAGPTGLSIEDYLAKVYGPPMQPAHVGEQVADIVSDPRYQSGIAYGLRINSTPVSLDL